MGFDLGIVTAGIIAACVEAITQRDVKIAMQGRIKIGEEAVAAGLADRLGSFDSVLAELQRPPAGGRPITPQTRSHQMTHTTTTAATPPKPKSGLTRLIDARVAKAKAQGYRPAR